MNGVRCSAVQTAHHGISKLLPLPPIIIVSNLDDGVQAQFVGLVAKCVVRVVPSQQRGTAEKQVGERRVEAFSFTEWGVEGGSGIWEGEGEELL